MANKDYSIRQEQIARFAKAMGHPARIAILQFLARQQNCYFGDIHEELPIAKATVSQHLKELKDAGLIQGEVEPPKVKYCINRDNWQLAYELFNGFLSQPLCKIEGCCGDNKQ
ncbi:MAG: ArsR/SmtB family transcription factor [Muribaculaceae bacterium]